MSKKTSQVPNRPGLPKLPTKKELPKKSKATPKKPLEIQTDLFAEFAQADQREAEAKRKKLKEDEERAYMEARYAEFVGPEKYAQMSPEEKAGIPEAYRKFKDEEFVKKFSKKVPTIQEMITNRFTEIYNLKRGDSLSAHKQAREEVMRSLKEGVTKQEQETYQYLLRIQAKPEPRPEINTQPNLPKEEPLTEKDYLNEDGSIKDNKPGEEYWGRFR